MKKELTESEAYAKLIDLCSAAEYSTGEVLQRLKTWGIDGSSAYKIVERLVCERFIDDERFARAFIRSKITYSRWGRQKVRQALIQKGIGPAEISQWMDEEIDLDVYYANLASALRSKAKSMPETLDCDCRAKLARFAASRGYEQSLIFEMLPEEDFWRYDDSEESEEDEDDDFS